MNRVVAAAVVVGVGVVSFVLIIIEIIIIVVACVVAFVVGVVVLVLVVATTVGYVDSGIGCCGGVAVDCVIADASVVDDDAISSSS